MRELTKMKNDTECYMAPTVECSFVNVEAGFAYSGDKNASTSDFEVDNSQNDADLWN